MSRKLNYRRLFKANITLLHAVDTIRRIREDDKLDWADAPIIASFIGGELILWGSDLLDWKKAPLKPLYIIDAMLIGGGIAAYAVAGEEGVYDYVDLITGEVNPIEYYEVVAPAVVAELTKKKGQVELFASMVFNFIDRQLQRTHPWMRRFPYMI